MNSALASKVFRIVSASLNGVEASFDLDGGSVSLVIESIDVTLSPTDDGAIARANEYGTQSILQRTTGGGGVGGLGDSTIMSLSVVDASNVDELLSAVEDNTPLDSTTQAKLQKIERDVAHMLERFSFRVGTVNVVVLASAAPPTDIAASFSPFAAKAAAAKLAASLQASDALHVSLRGFVYVDDDRAVSMSADSPDDNEQTPPASSSSSTTDVSPSVVPSTPSPPPVAAVLIRKRIAIQSISVKARVRESVLQGSSDITVRFLHPDDRLFA